MLKNRGATINPPGRFEIKTREDYDDGWYNHAFDENIPTLETLLMPENAKSIISRNDSPDLFFDQSINPYRGCEHGCIYCYARPAHAYMNLSPGIDFETKIFYKLNAAQLLKQELNKPKYQCKTIVLGANTDPYQPAEIKLKVTQDILKVLQEFKHPVAIITKSSLIDRDIDILKDMAKKGLVHIAISITTLSRDLKKIMEPRTSSPQARLRSVRKLTEAGIPVRVMMAPIIPMINDREIEHILQAASKVGAKNASYVLLRLPYEVKDLFRDWLNVHFPERAKHIMSIIQQMRGGKDYDSTFGKRMVGEGEFAELIAKRFTLACKRFNINTTRTRSLNTQIFSPEMDPPKPSPQLSLWET